MEESKLAESEFEEFTEVERRRKLLPWWIKFFCWFFMLFGVLAFICLILGFTSIKPALSFYGFETNEPFSLIGLLIIFTGTFKGFTAYLLWFEKNKAIIFGKIDAIIGIVLCIISMVVLPFLQEDFNLTLRLELVLLIPFYLKLKRIQNEWSSRAVIS